MFGVIINQIEGAFFSSHWQSLCRWAEKKGVRLIFYTGKALQSPIDQERNHSFTYSLINTEKLDGLLVFTASLGNYITEKELRNRIDSWASVPLISINYPLEGYTSITSESKEAIKELVDHMVKDHGYKKFAMVTGLKSNYDSRIREESFLTSLGESGITIAEENIFVGDFTPESGNKAAEYFIEKGLPEVVFCLNDDMAHSFIKTLRNNGFLVPANIAVTGFDGYPFTEYLFPSLSTVELPFADMSEKAAELLYEKIRNDSPPADIKVKCKFRTRQSCGCLVPGKEISEVCTDLTSGLSGKIDKSQIIKNQSILIDECLNRNLSDSDIHSDFISRLSSLREIKESHVFDDNIDLLQSLYWINSAAAGQIQYKKTYNFFLFQWRFREASRKISSKLYLRDLISELIETLPELGLDFFRMYLFCEPVNCAQNIPLPPETLKLHLQFRKGENSYCSETGTLKNTADILSCRESTVIKTLFFGEEVYGIIQFGLGDHFDVLYESLREVISNSLHQAIINRKMQEAQRKLEINLIETEILNKKFKDLSIRDDMTGLLNRRGFFEISREILENSEIDEQFYLFYLDLDGLKKINDTFGHNEGDWAISNFALALENCFRSNDIVARLGGDEFSALSKTESENYPVELDRRLATYLQQLNKSSGKKFALASSTGCIRFNKVSDTDISGILNQADHALYEEKRQKKRTSK